MKRFLTLLGREVSHYFHQPLAYIVLFFFLLITAANFHAGLVALNREPSQTSVVEAFFNTVLFWFPFVLIFPLLTMRLFSEEYKLGTIETLMTAPVRDSQVVLAKFLGSLFFYIVLWAPSLLYFVVFRWVSGQSAAESFGAYFGAYLLLVLVGMFYLSIGCLASAMTKNQIVAASVTFALICLLFFLGLLSFLFLKASSALRELIYYFSTIEHMAEFSRGLFDTRPIVFYLSMTVFMLFLTFHVFQYPPMEKLGVPRKIIRLNVTLQVLAMLVLLVGVNYFSFNHYARADFSRSQKFVLSDQTKRVLRELKKPVRVTVFFSPTVLSPETALFPDVQNLLKELIFSGRNKIEVEYVDPTRDLSRARELQEHYKFSASENVLILDYDGRSKFVPVSEMADFDMSPVESGDPPQLLAFKGEQALTNGMIALISPERLKVYFLEGHGEPTIGQGTPLSVFKDYVERQNATAAPLSFASLDSVPSDCASLIIVAPQVDIEEREATILANYWKANARLLVLLDPRAKTPRLDSLLKQVGVVPMDNRVLRTVRLPFATGILRDVTAEFLPKNAITKRMVGINILFPGATQSLGFDVAQSQAAGVQIWPLIQAGEEFWGESDYVTDEKKGVRYDEGKDVGQPVYVAVAAARGGVKDERVEVESAKLVAVGSSEFALDAALNQQGLDFLLSSMNWLLDRGQLTGIVPKTVQHFSLSLNDNQMGSIALYTMVVIPGIVALAGLIVWSRRRA